MRKTIHRLQSIYGRLAFIAVACLCVGAAHAQVGSIADDFKSATISGSRIVALDSGNDLYTSDDDGSSFQLRLDPSDPLVLPNITNETFESVEAFGSTVIAVGEDGLILRSTDSGNSWLQAATTPSIQGSLSAAAARNDGVNPNIWLAVGNDNEDGTIHLSNDDGENWTIVSTEADTIIEDVIWTGSRWLYCGSDDFFSGVVFSSTDGINWTSSSLPAGDTLTALATDGNGVVLAVGLSGRVIRSTDDGLSFTELSSLTVDLYAVVVDSTGDFYVGGDQRLIVKISGTTQTTAVPATSSASPVLDFVLIDDAPVAVGSFSVSVRTIPLTLEISAGGAKDYVLTVSQSLSGKSYYIETTTDLTADDWAIVSGTSVLGTGGVLTFDVDKNGDRRFWRVVEF